MDDKWYYFIDKCLPFGASISCSIFQGFSDAIAHIMQFKTGRKPINYLDDFLFLAFLKIYCNQQIETFLEICERINFPIALEKTEWASERITFLGLLIDAMARRVCIPLEKINKAKDLMNEMLKKK